MGSRAGTLDLKEFTELLKFLGLFPARLTKTEVLLSQRESILIELITADRK